MKILTNVLIAGLALTMSLASCSKDNQNNNNNNSNSNNNSNTNTNAGTASVHFKLQERMVDVNNNNSTYLQPAASGKLELYATDADMTARANKITSATADANGELTLSQLAAKPFFFYAETAAGTKNNTTTGNTTDKLVSGQVVNYSVTLR